MPNFDFRELSAPEIDRVVRDMDRHGYARIADFFPAETIAEARAWVMRELERHGGEYFSYIGREPVYGSLMAELGASPALQRAFAAIYERGLGRPAPRQGVFQVLRVLAGATGLKEAYQFHYDAYVVTALVPIALPLPGEARGDLVLYPKLRGIRSSVAVNVLEKILLQNRLAQRIAGAPLTRRLFKARLLRMEPGDIYFFWGYQSLHGNEPCYASSVRSTALFHFADPHARSVLVTAIKRLRRRREQRIRERLVARSARRAS